MNAKTTDLLTTDAQVTSMLVQRIMWILWPSFLMAGVLEILVFAMVDPQDLHWFGHAVQLSREGIYTIAFFAFWFITMLSSAFTVLLAIPALEVNH
jgi:hypothetical protein